MKMSAQLSWAAICCLGLYGCAGRQPPPPAQRPLDSYTALEKQRQTYFDAWLQKATVAPKAFYACVHGYAASHQSTKLTATELAGASVSACHHELSEFRNAEHATYSLNNESTADAQTDRAVAEVTDDAKGVVLRMMAEQR